MQVLKNNDILYLSLHHLPLNSIVADTALKLVRTLLNYRVLVTSTAAISLQINILSMHLYTSDQRHAWFHLHGTSWPARSA